MNFRNKVIKQGCSDFILNVIIISVSIVDFVDNLNSVQCLIKWSEINCMTSTYENWVFILNSYRVYCLKCRTDNLRAYLFSKLFFYFSRVTDKSCKSWNSYSVIFFFSNCIIKLDFTVKDIRKVFNLIFKLYKSVLSVSL